MVLLFAQNILYIHQQNKHLFMLQAIYEMQIKLTQFSHECCKCESQTNIFLCPHSLIPCIIQDKHWSSVVHIPLVPCLAKCTPQMHEKTYFERHPNGPVRVAAQHPNSRHPTN